MPDIKYGQGNFTGNRRNTDSNMSDKEKEIIKTLNAQNSEELRRLIEANGIVNGHLNDRLYTKFSRIPIMDPYNTTNVTKEYVFFTRPDLHIFNASSTNLWSTLSSYSFFVDAADRYAHVCQQLELSAGGISKSPFMNLLSNTIRYGVDTPSLEAENELMYLVLRSLIEEALIRVTKILVFLPNLKIPSFMKFICSLRSMMSIVSLRILVFLKLLIVKVVHGCLILLIRSSMINLLSISL